MRTAVWDLSGKIIALWESGWQQLLQDMIFICHSVLIYPFYLIIINLVIFSSEKEDMYLLFCSVHIIRIKFLSHTLTF